MCYGHKIQITREANHMKTQGAFLALTLSQV